MAWGLTGVGCRAGRDENAAADLLKVVQVGPVRGEFHHHATSGFTHVRANLNQARPPGAGLAFAKRIVLAAAIVPTAALATGQGFQRNFIAGGLRRRRRRIGNRVTHVDQQVVRRGVQEETKQVGEVTMVAQAISLQARLEFLVAVFAFAAVGVAVVGRARQHPRRGGW